MTGVATGTSQSIWSTCSIESPIERGIAGLTSAITSRAFATAAGAMSTETPRLT